MLQIIKEIKEIGLENVINKYKLNYKDYGHKFLLKYDQIESSPFRLISAVRECRGIVISKDLEVMSYLFYRFFNYGEVGCDEINWTNSRTFKKEDGSLIGVYWDWILNEWCVQTSGTADANTNVDIHPFTFKQLFETTIPSNFYSKLEKGNSYIFELCTPYNIVVTPHKESYIKLLGCRNLETLTEYGFEDLKEISNSIGVDLVESYDCNSIEDIVAMAKELPQTEEGYIVCCYDAVNGSFKRLKVKNPSYVALHHLKGKICKEELFTVVFTGETDEFVALMPEYKVEIEKRTEFIEVLKKELQELTNKFLKIDKGIRKDVALWLQSKTNKYTKPFISHYFTYLDKGASILPMDILKKCEVKFLQKVFDNLK